MLLEKKVLTSIILQRNENNKNITNKERSFMIHRILSIPKTISDLYCLNQVWQIKPNDIKIPAWKPFKSAQMTTKTTEQSVWYILWNSVQIPLKVKGIISDTTHTIVHVCLNFFKLFSLQLNRWITVWNIVAIQQTRLCGL